MSSSIYCSSLEATKTLGWSGVKLESPCDESHEGGVWRGDIPLHCMSRRHCSARAISEASHDGSSGNSHVRAERSPSIMCSNVTMSTTVCVDVRPGHKRDTWPDSPIRAQFTITAARPRNPNAFCHVPMFATLCPNGLWWTCTSLKASDRISSMLLASAHRPANGKAAENRTTYPIWTSISKWSENVPSYL